MNQPLDELYLTWLTNQVGRPPRSSRSYSNLLHQLYTTEFVWMVPNDDNRAEDGRSLRDEFCGDLELEDLDPDWMALGCSMLELLVGLARRLSFMAEGEPRAWFWHLIDNLGIRFDDRRYSERDVEEVLNDVIWRTYGPQGEGGLFPLRLPHRDQRWVELWYQMSSYLLERN